MSFTLVLVSNGISMLIFLKSIDLNNDLISSCHLNQEDLLIISHTTIENTDNIFDVKVKEIYIFS